MSGEEGTGKESNESSPKRYEFDIIFLELPTLKNVMSDEEISEKVISSKLSTLKITASDMITSFHKKAEDISDDVKKFYADVIIKASDTQSKLDIRTNAVNENVE